MSATSISIAFVIEGQTVRLGIDLENVNVFSAETGRRIDGPDRADDGAEPVTAGAASS